MSYAKQERDNDGTFSVKTPGRGFTLLKGFDEQTAHNVVSAINRAYENGLEDKRRAFLDVLGPISPED